MQGSLTFVNQLLNCDTTDDLKVRGFILATSIVNRITHRAEIKDFCVCAHLPCLSLTPSLGTRPPFCIYHNYVQQFLLTK